MGVSCYWDVELIDAATGRVKQHVPWHKNCILNGGLNYLIAGTNGLAYWGHTFAVGSGNSTPVATQTGLDVQILRKGGSTNAGLYLAPASDANPITASGIIGTQFSTSEANGTIREMGLVTGMSGGTFLCRDLLRDVNGDPIEVVKTSADLLNVRVKAIVGRMSETPFTTVITDNKGTEYTVKGIALNVGLPYILEAISTAIIWTYNKAGANNTTDPAPAQTGIIGSIVGSEFSSAPVWAAAHNGPADGWYRDATITIPTTTANGDIGEFFLGKDLYSYGSRPFMSRITFTPKLAKTSARQIAITLRVSIAGV